MKKAFVIILTFFTLYASAQNDKFEKWKIKEEKKFLQSKSIKYKKCYASIGFFSSCNISDSTQAIYNAKFNFPLEVQNIVKTYYYSKMSKNLLSETEFNQIFSISHITVNDNLFKHHLITKKYKGKYWIAAVVYQQKDEVIKANKYALTSIFDSPDIDIIINK